MKKTFLFSKHKNLGAKFTEFNGWKMPVHYTSIIDEHNAVRTSVGMFDIAHMGTFIITGENSGKFLNYFTLGNILELPNKRARYSMILNENGGVKDDVVVYKFNKEFMVVVNAGNMYKDFEWFNKYKTNEVKIVNVSDDICLIAVQGPKAVDVLQIIAENDIRSMKYFTVSELKLENINADFCRIARTGYTGEDGFEIFISKRHIVKLWEKLINLSVKPCGLGCRDTLRLEACMPLHGHEIDENINPIDAGFRKTINWDSDFMGKSKLLYLKTKCLKKSVAFECLSGIARNKNEIFVDDKKVGYVTSGCFSPTFKKSIGMALLDINSEFGELKVKIYNDKREIKVIEKPFYKRQK